MEGKKVCSQAEQSIHNFWQVVPFVIFCAVGKLRDFCLLCLQKTRSKALSFVVLCDVCPVSTKEAAHRTKAVT